MKTILIVSLFACLFAGNASAQSNWEGTKATPDKPWLFGSHSAPARFGKQTHLGIFPVFGSTREGRAVHLLSRFLPFRQHRPTSARPQLFSLFGDPYGGSRYFGRSLHWDSYYHFPHMEQGTELYNSQRFVDEWKNREPHRDALPSSSGGDLTRSTVLAVGMTEEQVLSVVGSPLERVSVGTRSVWKYSAYSLLFEEGSLQEIR